MVQNLLHLTVEAIDDDEDEDFSNEEFTNAIYIYIILI